MTCGSVTSYGNTKLTVALSNVNTVAYTFSQGYICIYIYICYDGYGGALGGVYNKM